MSTNINGFLVVLEHEQHEDAAAPVLLAIRQLRGVLSVEQVAADYLTDSIAESRVRRELSERLWAVLHPKRGE